MSGSNWPLAMNRFPPWRRLMPAIGVIVSPAKMMGNDLAAKPNSDTWRGTAWACSANPNGASERFMPSFPWSSMLNGSGRV